MSKLKLIDIALLALMVLGFLGALKVSLANLDGIPCPHVWTVPICYIVLVAYGLMLASIVIKNNACKHYFFTVGWGTAFVIALLGSIAELTSGGGVCPTTGGGGIRVGSSGSVPLCYASLTMLVIILILFLLGPYKHACDIHNNKVEESGQ